MRRLLYANLNRLLMNRAFWLSVIFMALAESAVALILLRNGPMPRDMILFMSLQFISILFAVFFSLFLGTEYSDGTIRNKVTCGHKRSNIYLSSLITGFFAATVIYLAEILAGSIVGVMFFSAPQYTLGEIAMIGITGFMACISFVSMFTLIGMLLSNKALTAITSILTAFAILFAGIFVFNRLFTPDSLTGAELTVYTVLFDILPSGQLLQTMTLQIEAPTKLIAYSAILSVVITFVGLGIFRKKEFK